MVVGSGEDALDKDKGALVTAGGMGIGKQLYAGINVVAKGTEFSESPTTGTLVTEGGLGVIQLLMLHAACVACTTRVIHVTDTNTDTNTNTTTTTGGEKHLHGWPIGVAFDGRGECGCDGSVGAETRSHLNGPTNLPRERHRGRHQCRRPRRHRHQQNQWHGFHVAGHH